VSSNIDRELMFVRLSVVGLTRRKQREGRGRWEGEKSRAGTGSWDPPMCCIIQGVRDQ
jgi:hypothetical protein